MNSKESSWRPGDWLTAASVAVGAMILLIFVFPYCSGYGTRRVTLFDSVRGLWSSPDWQHGLLVPFILAGLLIYKRKELWGTPAEGSYWGLAALMFALFSYWVGYKTNVYYFGFVGVQVLLAALILWFLGWGYFRKLFFFWCFFAFTWPLYFLTDTLAFKLRVVMIQVSSAFLKLVGISNIRSGTSIQSPPDFDTGVEQGAKFALDIADPCSGIRSLFALMMVAALWGYLVLPRAWQRWALFFSAVPLAIFGNFVRVNLLVFGSLWWGADFAVGEAGGTSNYHFLSGVAVFVVALGGMVLLGTFLKSGFKMFRRGSVVRSVRVGPAEERV